ncbi:MAG TPA: phosphoribosylanthranilate isomerase [Bryobacteraceae bacterium]|nr:phosphoribosylanthranilate isomerase [Bryobacteraceae bacterium]
MMVKICGITNREDALAAAEAGASALGFNFYRQSPRYISPTGAAMIAAKIPASVWKVGVFVDETPDAIAKIALDAGLDVAQLHGISEARGLRIWRAIPAGAPVPEEISGPAEALLIDTPSQQLRGGTGVAWNWAEATRYTGKIVIAGGLDVSNVRQAIQEAQPWGVDACSRLEKSPGVKDHEKMTTFIKVALAA